jgi:hypothetical protein
MLSKFQFLYSSVRARFAFHSLVRIIVLHFIVVHKCLTYVSYDYVCTYLSHMYVSINPLRVCQGSLFTPE